MIRHPVQGKPPVAVAEHITTEHSVLNISHFLDVFRRREVLLYTTSIKPKHLIIDRSMTLLLAVLRSFNGETTSQFLHRCYRIIKGIAEEDDYNHVMVHACIAHVMKSMKNDLKRIW